MNQQVCLVCGQEFSPKRSDASYCSQTCRAKANYKKRKIKTTENPEKPIFNSVKPELSIPKTKNLIIQGEISVQTILQIIENSGNEINNMAQNAAILNSQNEALVAQNLALKKLSQEYDQVQVKKMQMILELPDDTLFNTYLNTEYLEAKKMDKVSADSKLISEWEITRYSATPVRKRISDYRLGLKSKILTLQTQVSNLNSEILKNERLMVANQDTIREQQHHIRFHQSRIVRYEGLLVGK